MNRLFFSLVFVFITSIAGSILEAEQLSVRVLDSSGAVIPGVSITLIDQITAQHWPGVTDDSGQAQFTNRRQGAYLVKADMPGFQSLVSEVELGPEEVLVDLVLGVDGLADEILVTATGNPQLAARSSRSYGIIEGEQLESAREAYLPDAQEPGKSTLRAFDSGGGPAGRRAGRRRAWVFALPCAPVPRTLGFSGPRRGHAARHSVRLSVHPGGSADRPSSVAREWPALPRSRRADRSARDVAHP